MPLDAYQPNMGLGTESEVTPRTFLLNEEHVILMGIVVVSTARDSGNSPTTTLRPGLVLGKITATGKYGQYDNSAADGSEVATGVLYDQVKVIDADANATDAAAIMVIHGYVDESQLIGCNDAAKVDLAGQLIFG